MRLLPQRGSPVSQGCTRRWILSALRARLNSCIARLYKRCLASARPTAPFSLLLLNEFAGEWYRGRNMRLGYRKSAPRTVRSPQDPQYEIGCAPPLRLAALTQTKTPVRPANHESSPSLFPPHSIRRSQI